MSENKKDEENYRRALGFHDWYYQYSDDHGVWKKGSENFQNLRAMQERLDPDHSIWNTYAPEMYQVKVEKTETPKKTKQSIKAPKPKLP